MPVLSQPHDSWTGERGFVQVSSVFTLHAPKLFDICCTVDDQN